MIKPDDNFQHIRSLSTWLAGQLDVPGPDLVLVVVLPQVLLQGLGDWQVTDVAVGLQLVAHGTAS